MSKRAAPIDVRSMRNEDFLSYKISVLSRVLDRGVDKKLVADFNLPLTALRIAGHLHAHGEGRVLAIARSMHLLGSQVSQGMMELVANGLVAKKPDPSDKRGSLFRLTPKGRRLYEGVLAKAQFKQQQVADLIGPENYAVVSSCLDALIAHYGAAVRPAADVA
jgi:DNA-binding MarR family transcriptional regulator